MITCVSSSICHSVSTRCSSSCISTSTFPTINFSRWCLAFVVLRLLARFCRFNSIRTCFCFYLFIYFATIERYIYTHTLKN
jgi:hypothetical protein